MRSRDVEPTAAPSFAPAAFSPAISVTFAILLPVKETIDWFDL